MWDALNEAFQQVGEHEGKADWPVVTIAKHHLDNFENQ